MYIDADLLRAAKVAAVREDKPEYLVVEEALRRHLGHDVLERIWRAAALDEGSAERLAVDESRAVRRARGTASKGRPARRRAPR